MSSLAVTLGIDIGGTNTKFGLVKEDGQCLSQISIPTEPEGNIENFISKLTSTLSQMLTDISESVEIKAVGIGAPNGNYYTGMIEKAPNLHWGEKVPIAKLVEEKLNVPVKLTNDANAAAIGEMTFGAAKGMKNFVVITLGTGLGSGIVVNGQLVYGHDGFAGELGHVTVKHDGRMCACGKQGCLETYVSATGIKRTVYKLLADMTVPSSLRGVSFDELTALMITHAAMRGDEVAKKAFDYTGKILGSKLADTVAHLSPEAIILFGGLANAGNYLLGPTRFYLEKNLFGIYKNKIKLLLSDLKGDNTAVLGAAALAWNEISEA